MGSLQNCVIFAAILAKVSAQICCNLNQECLGTAEHCDIMTQCYWQPGFAYICTQSYPLTDYRCYDDVYSDFWGSESYCNQLGLTLAKKVLRDPEMVMRILATECSKNAWVGYRKVGKHWEWIDDGDTNYDVVRWQLGKPDNLEASEGCAEIAEGKDGIAQLNDVNCFQQRRILCEIQLEKF